MTTYIQNRKARFDFDILETFEAGLVLHGYEVKGIRAKKGKLEGAYVIVRGGEAYLVGAHITAFQPVNTPKSYDSERPRKLLLSKKEIARLENQTETAGLTAMAVRLYNNKQKIKLEVAVARGKKKHDKRESIKARDVKREINRTLKSQ
ncbi:SsrA-binding protein SmpB [Candidatus Nomurabacteria bacterium]|nr:SsrA-binding protein SmpB [Candidatus Kaiserbacteria bacterium]MCB9814727.1 SsrA-binding protein SmpB [Candidatus Nomurabacteria bacterium]